MNKFLDALGKSILTILVILLIGYGWAFFELKIMLKSYPEMFGYIFYLEETEDMVPDFNKDDVVIVKKDSTYSLGDRVLYLNEKSEYKVRTVQSMDSFSTNVKCALCENVDETISNSSVIGRVIGKFYYVGTLIKFFKQKVVLISLAVTGFVLVVVSQYIHEKPKKIS